MKRLLYILLPLLFAACSESNEPVASVGETVTVTVGVALPQAAVPTAKISTRGETYTQVVDKVLCAVFDKDGNEVENLRETLDATAAPMVYSPRLAIGQTYNVAFFAYRDGAYNIGEFPKVSRVTGSDAPAEKYFEAFSASRSITVDKAQNISVTLKRTVAKIHIGTTTEDLTAAEALDMNPSTTTATIKGAFGTYNVLTGQPVSEGNDTQPELVLTSEADLGTFTVGGTEYRRLGAYYFFTDGGNVDLSFDFKAGDNSIRGSLLDITGIPVGRNVLTSIAGEILTGTVNYTVELSDKFDEDKQQSEDMI